MLKDQLGQVKDQMTQNFIKTKFEELGLNPNGEINYVFFWAARPKVKGIIDEGCCCQWWFSTTRIDNVNHITAEHAMMYAKAKMFNDEQALSAILESKHPRDVKQIGRQVRPFDPVKWDNESYAIVRNINLEKFRQDKRILPWLLSQPENTVFVEASPYDRIWGIGLANDGKVDLTNPSNWQGYNKLGFAITEVFQQLCKENGV